MSRACVIVLDAVGAGELPDASDWGDEGSDTLGNVARAVGGLDLPNLEPFVRAFTDHANERIEPDRLVPSVSFDCEAALPELTTEAVGKLNMLAPFGMSNPRPRLRLSGLRLQRRPERFGGGGKHLSVFVQQDGRVMRLVAWNWGDRAEAIPSGAAVEAAHHDAGNWRRGPAATAGTARSRRRLSPSPSAWRSGH